MASTILTRERAFGLRVFARGKEEILRFPSMQALARAFARRVSGDNHGNALYRSRAARVHTAVSVDGAELREICFTDVAVDHPVWGTVWNTHSAVASYEPFGPDGRSLQVLPLLRLGRSLGGSRRSARSGASRGAGADDALYRGWGPVPGIRKWRGGGGYGRRVRTYSERRLNSLTIAEDGEVPPRAARSVGRLPTNWDDLMRGRQRSWKEQHRGRKAWDR